jgi:hypothetical protein
MVSSFDVAFSYLSMVGTGSLLGRGASSMTGVTVLTPRQFDISVNSTGASILPNLASIPIVPARYWTNAGSAAWDANVAACNAGSGCFVQYYLSGSTIRCGPTFNCGSFPTNMMTINPADILPTFDPIANRVLIGSGPWECGSGATLGGPNCSSSGNENPPLGGSYTLTRFGDGLMPGASGDYVRSSGNLALWLWSEDTGDFTRDFLTVALVAACYRQPAAPLGGIPAPSSCAHFQQGIGANGGPKVVDITTVGIVNRFMGLNWVSPFNWYTSPPTGIAPLTALVLYEGSATLNPASIVSCNVTYPAGGYDC